MDIAFNCSNCGQMKTFLAFCLVVIMVGCGKPDPVQQLKTAAQRFKDDPSGKVQSFEYNVRKTDSLVSPLFGMVQYTEKVATQTIDSSETNMTDLVFVANFAYQENRWVFKGAEPAHENGGLYLVDYEGTMNLAYKRWNDAIKPVKSKFEKLVNP